MPKRSFGFFRRKQGRCSNVGALYIFGLSELTVTVTPSAPYRKKRECVCYKTGWADTYSQLQAHLFSKIPPNFFTYCHQWLQINDLAKILHSLRIISMLISFSKPSCDSLYLHKFSALFYPSFNPFNFSVPLVLAFLLLYISAQLVPTSFFLSGFLTIMYPKQRILISAKLLSSTHLQESLGSKHSPQEYLDLSRPIWKAAEINLPDRSLRERFF